MSWFRLYTNLPNCVKLRKLTPEDQIGYVWCLCLHKDGHLVGQTVKDIAWALRLPESDTASMLLRLVNGKLLAADFTPVGWHERQYESDCSTPRVQKHRAKQADAVSMKRFRNVTETPDETYQNRTEQIRAEQNRADTPPPADAGTPKGESPAKRRNGYTSWTQDEFRASVETANTDNLLTPAEVDEFCLYWFEPTPTGRERFKTEKTWSTRGRMQTALRMVYAKQRLFAAKQPTLKGVIPDMGEMKE